MSVAENLGTRPTLAGKYALLEVIGSGATGTVYEAEQLAVGKRVAVKLMNRADYQQPERLYDFVAEARAAARVCHANVVDIYDLGMTPDGVPYLVLELLRGETLTRTLAQRGALAPSLACEWMLQLLAGLSAAHTLGIVHGDLKPGGVMVTSPRPDRPLLKILDLGITRSSAEARGPQAELQGSAPMYAAPERLLGQDLTPLTDIYAAAAVFYFMLTGKQPFSGTSAAEVRAEVLRGACVPMLEANPELPKSLVEIVETGMRRVPHERVASTEEFANAIRPFVASGRTHSFGFRRRVRISDPRPLLTVPRDVTIYAPEAGPHSMDPRPPESSVVPIQMSGTSRGVTDSLLVSPRFPRAASTPKLRIGKDFMPSPGDLGWDETRERSAKTSAPRYRRSRRSVLPALLVTGFGFALGVLIAWITGAI
jgi:serine/threonine protein kinase